MQYEIASSFMPKVLEKSATLNRNKVQGIDERDLEHRYA